MKYLPKWRRDKIKSAHLQNSTDLPPGDVSERERTLPYIDEVPGNPSVEDMLKVVVEEGKRPPLLDRWRQNPVSRTFTFTFNFLHLLSILVRVFCATSCFTCRDKSFAVMCVITHRNKSEVLSLWLT